MTDYLHPVSKACKNPTDENIARLNKTELVYVVAEVFDLQPPTDEDGETIHPDEYSGTLGRDMMESIIKSERDGAEE